MAKACPVIHSQGALRRMQAVGGILVTEAELCTGKTANGPFFSFVKCASHDVRGKVPSGVIPTPLPLLSENQECLIWRTVELTDRVSKIRVSIKSWWGWNLSLFPWISKSGTAEWLRALNYTVTILWILSLFVNCTHESRWTDFHLVGKDELAYLKGAVSTRPNKGHVFIASDYINIIINCNTASDQWQEGEKEEWTFFH